VKKLASISLFVAIIIPCVIVSAVEKKSESYSIGDRGPAGGVIFYDKGNAKGGWRYLEAATEDLSAGVQWWNSQYKYIGQTGMGIGTGRANTSKIISAQGEGKYAAKICVDYRGGGKSDWFLPSRNELNMMRTQMKKNRANGFVDALYWTSSEVDGSLAWTLDFSDDSQDGCGKEFLARVRAVRAF
jgi:hypothetical protein